MGRADLIARLERTRMAGRANLRIDLAIRLRTWQRSLGPGRRPSQLPRSFFFLRQPLSARAILRECVLHAFAQDALVSVMLCEGLEK